MVERKAPQWLIVLAFMAVYIVWGTTYLAVIYGLRGFPPFMLSALRYLMAGILLLGWCFIRKEKWPGWQVVRTCSISGLFMLVGGSGMVAWAEQYVTSGQAAIVIAAEPFIFLLADKKRWREYFSNRFIITGLLIGFVGIILFFGGSDAKSAPSGDATMQWVGYSAILIGTVFWVSGALLAEGRLEKGVSNIVSSCIQLFAAGICSSLISGATGEWGKVRFNEVPAEAWAGLFYLVIFGSLIAYMAFTWLITVRPPALVSTHTYVNPVVAVLVGWAFVNEQLGWVQMVGMVVILLGVLLTNFPSYKLSFNQQRA
ncbi:EamA family transporter [Chitinophaga sp. S165]|uniref:EamA family transporter n=1 Tax=Chitinophaga sp. S165 TaxID=2135462 RepID=UPI000D70EC04|nr:EamA family transporter [Chitinophaga sp. S165]PWV51602.1 drug/metabolite transporter (DMT)-like permease [Chitinophaga sp. S165]